MSSTGLETAAPAADLDEAGALALFETMAAAKPNDDPIPEVAEVVDAPAEEITEETPAAPAAVAPATTTTPAAAAPAAAATDIWSSATPELRAAHEAALADRDHRYQSDVGRQAAYQRQIQSLRDELAAKTATPAAPATPAATPPSLRENPVIKKSLEEYPDVGLAPVLDALDASNAENARLGRALSSIEEDRRAGFVAAQEQALTVAHPDWRAACASKDFADWLDAQPAAVKQIVERNGKEVVDAAEAAAMVGSFKAHFALTHPRPQPAAPAAPAAPATAAPTNLAERRDAQLRAVTTPPKGAPVAIPDGAPGGQAEAVFAHYAAKKAKKG